MAQYHHWRVTLIQASYPFKSSSVLRVCVCVCLRLLLYEFITCKLMYPPQQSRQRTVPSPQGSLVLPFITISTSHSHLVLNPCAPGKHSPFSTILLFLRMLYKWDLQCVTFGVWLFFTQGNSLQIHSGCSVSQWFSPFHRQVTVHGMDGAQPVYECTHCRSSRLLAVHCGCSE